MLVWKQWRRWRWCWVGGVGGTGVFSNESGLLGITQWFCQQNDCLCPCVIKNSAITVHLWPRHTYIFYVSWHCRCPWAERGNHWEFIGGGLPSAALTGHPGLLQLPHEAAPSLQLPRHTLLRWRPGLCGPAPGGSQLHNGRKVATMDVIS